MSTESDRLLVQRIRANEPGAWDDLFKRYQGRLAAYVRRRLRDHAAVDDVVQNTFVGFLNSLPNYDDRRDLQTWLFTIAAHKVTDQLRKTGRRPYATGSEADEEMLDRSPDDRQRAASSLARSAERREKEEDALGDAEVPGEEAAPGPPPGRGTVPGRVPGVEPRMKHGSRQKTGINSEARPAVLADLYGLV